ncbi:MarR family winged helix-turn-helix transcriptional regulator [Actinomadura fibrosa]|uniref:MarR family winged helix-turn-helix transcriptional regulator n=1 Tax=Actinomadura fibrosa TaxID=111802 RepID=A0ABW2XFT9_9ACTN|nr:MarR family transcriptional regulator [Actinomadura fibrosa]
MLDDLLERILAGDGDAAGRHLGLGLLLATAHQGSRAAMNAGLRPLGIEVREFAMLAALETYGPVSQRRLTDLTGIDKSTMVRIVDGLEDGGLVRRERAPEDRRAYSVVLTEEGLRVLGRGREVTGDVGERLFGWLTPEQREQLVELLRQVAEHASE